MPLPAVPSTVALYISALADQGRLAAISKAHQAANCDSPCAMKHAAVSEVWKGIRRSKGIAQTGKAPVLTKALRAIVAAIPDGTLGLRDRALLLTGFAGALRRSELVALDAVDFAFTDDGAVATIRRSKTDQEAVGRKIGIPFGSAPETCPIRALKAWMESAEISSGPLFRPVNRHGRVAPARLTAQSVSLIVKRRAARAGLDAAQFSGHSLRAGLATSAAMNGASERVIMNQTGHRSAATVRRYIRDGSLFRDNAAAQAGL